MAQNQGDCTWTCNAVGGGAKQVSSERPLKILGCDLISHAYLREDDGTLYKIGSSVRFEGE